MKSILIIDDHAMARQLAKWSLDGADYTVYEASNGAVGLKLAKALRPDLILLDVMMPGDLDGYQVCEQLRASDGHAHLKIILLSANDAQQDKERGQEAGANAYLTKPFKPAALRSLVDKLLES